MNVLMQYNTRSGLRAYGGQNILSLAPNLDRDRVAFDAQLQDPIPFREAISALHDVVINDLRFVKSDKSAYREWQRGQRQVEAKLAQEARVKKNQEIARDGLKRPPKELQEKYRFARKAYWNARGQLTRQLMLKDPLLWRRMMPYDPIVTVADDVLMFECFSADESSYGCLTVSRDTFQSPAQVQNGTTNVDYSWELFDHFQQLRSYRSTRFQIDPQGFEVRTEDGAHREEKIEIPDGWLTGLMQMQSALCIPMRKVTLPVSAVYSLLAFLKRRKARTSPRAIRFELQSGHEPMLVLEPWEKSIVGSGQIYRGPDDEPVRIWGRRRLLSLARVLPLAREVDVYLLGTGLPSFWVVKMDRLNLTLGLSGWTTNNWSQGSAVGSLLPRENITEQAIAGLASRLQQQRVLSLQDLAGSSGLTLGKTAAGMNQLAVRGQVIFDLNANAYRWRQALPVALSDREAGLVHPETERAMNLMVQNQVRVQSQERGPRGGWIVTAQAGNQECEVLISDEGVVRKGKCRCSWHYRFGVRNGACAHLQAIRDYVLQKSICIQPDNWYDARRRWAGAS